MSANLKRFRRNGCLQVDLLAVHRLGEELLQRRAHLFQRLQPVAVQHLRKGQHLQNRSKKKVSRKYGGSLFSGLKSKEEILENSGGNSKFGDEDKIWQSQYFGVEDAEEEVLAERRPLQFL